MSNVRILIADDHELIRRGLVSALSDRPEWTIVAGRPTVVRPASWPLA